jgi:gas vesicle protein
MGKENRKKKIKSERKQIKTDRKQIKTDRKKIEKGKNRQKQSTAHNHLIIKQIKAV